MLKKIKPCISEVLFFLYIYKTKMEKEIVFKVEVSSEDDYKRIHEMLKVSVANMELAGSLKIISLNQEKELIKK